LGKKCQDVFVLGGGRFFCNPKLNMIENTFAEIDAVLLRMRRADALKGKSWLVQRTERRNFLRRKIRMAIRRLNKNKDYFKNQYATYKERCNDFIKTRGKRLRKSKW
jgi:hypothetical protein